jgi:hypothetical protein
MALNTSPRFQLWYNGTPAEKLAQARLLRQEIGAQLLADADFMGEIETLRSHCLALSTQMQAMDLGSLCSACAARDDGGCCSASMADNTDSLQILINLLLEQPLHLREPADSECCFLGPTGCPFMAKPIFCLNYNCHHICTGSEPGVLALLEQRAAAVLSQQTRIESLLLERLRCLP